MGAQATSGFLNRPLRTEAEARAESGRTVLWDEAAHPTRSPQAEMDRWRVEFDRVWRALRYDPRIAGLLDVAVPGVIGEEPRRVPAAVLFDDLALAHQYAMRWQRAHEQANARSAVESAGKAAVAPVLAVLEALEPRERDEARHVRGLAGDGRP